MDGDVRSALITGYIDDVLEGVEREEVARRVKDDAAWREEYEAQLQVSERLKVLETPRLSSKVRARLGAALRRHLEPSLASEVVVPFEPLQDPVASPELPMCDESVDTTKQAH